jgi:hypothetical protein
MTPGRALAALALALLVLPDRRVGAAEPDGCVACHGALEGALAAPVEALRADAHAAAGLSCADCHGGDPKESGLEAMDPARGFRGTPKPAEVPGFCGHCHADVAYMRARNPGLPIDQLELYATSVHGRRLAAGDDKVATCVSCHGAHGILGAQNAASPVYAANVARTCARCHADAAYMAGYDVPTSQFAEYQQSVHAELLFSRHDLGAPTCNDCHGNHSAYPPGASSVAGVCGQCHAVQRDLFVASPHKAAFERLQLPQCATCHGKHAIHRSSDAMAGAGDRSVCISCHAEGSPGYAAAAAMGGAIGELDAALGEAGAALESAARAGMEMSDARFTLQGAHEALVRSRTLVHAGAPDALLAEARKGRGAADGVRAASRAALDELARRRRQLVLPLAAFAAVLVLLVLKLRDLER